jgi:hypothetical protein
MKEICRSWQPLVRDDKTGEYKVSSDQYEFTSEKELRSKLGITETQTPPKLIVIDEISMFSVYDLDLIDKFA